MTDPKIPTGLPADIGNELSDRAGHQGDSPSGRTDTPAGTPTPDTQVPDAVPTGNGHERGIHETGTSFGTTGEDDQRL